MMKIINIASENIASHPYGDNYYIKVRYCTHNESKYTTSIEKIKIEFVEMGL